MDAETFYALEKVDRIWVREFDPATGAAWLEFRDACVYVDLRTGEWLEPPPFERPEWYTLPSSCGTKLLRDLTGKGSGVRIEDIEGNELGNLKGRGLIRVIWTPDSSGVIYQVRRKGESGLYLYSLEDRDSRMIHEGTVYEADWSPDGRHLIVHVPNQGVYVHEDRASQLIVLRAGDFEEVARLGEYVRRFSFSDDGKKLAYTEYYVDEEGRMDGNILRCHDFESAECTNVLAIRRYPCYTWAGNDMLAVGSDNPDGTPFLSLYTLDREEICLVESSDASHLHPYAYLADIGKAVYVKQIRELDLEELWTAGPGEDPKRLVPRREYE